jgi:carbon starvation protein
VTTILIKSGRLKWAWVTAIPLAWDAVVTLTASNQKVFSDNPKLGFFAQRDEFQDALDKGQVVAPAKSLDDMHQVVTNSTVDGILAALFAVMTIVVVLDASRIWLRVIVGRRTLPTTETAFVESRLMAPAGLFPTGEERGARRCDGPGRRRCAQRPLHA